MSRALPQDWASHTVCPEMGNGAVKAQRQGHGEPQGTLALLQPPLPLIASPSVSIFTYRILPWPILPPSISKHKAICWELKGRGSGRDTPKPYNNSS